MAKKIIFRPEITDLAMLRAIDMLRHEKGSVFFTMDRTKLVHEAVSNEWERLHPGMNFPDENGTIYPKNGENHE